MRHFDINKFFASENLVYFNAKWPTAGKLHLIVNQRTFQDAVFIFKAYAKVKSKVNIKYSYVNI